MSKQLQVDKFAALLAEQVQMYSDGGGKVEALPTVLIGAHDVAHFMVTVFERMQRLNTRIDTTYQRFNGSLGLLIFENNELATALTIEADAGKIHRIYAVRNPDKLQGLQTTVA